MAKENIRCLTALVKFVNKLKNSVRNKSKSESGTEILTAQELTNAEELWIKPVQAASFDEEIKFLYDHRQNKTVPPTYVSQFGLFLENGVVKCKGHSTFDSNRGQVCYNMYYVTRDALRHDLALRKKFFLLFAILDTC